MKTVAQAFTFLQKLGAPQRLLRHVELVGEAAAVLLAALARQGVQLDRAFVRAGVGLHDAGKAVLVALMMIGCTSPAGRSAGDRELWPRGDDVADLVCDRLPQTRPAGVVLSVGRVDGESLTYVLDVALVADAACPKRPPLKDASCVRLADDAMDYVWRELVAAAPHEIATERHGECIHCGGPWFAIEWPNGRCDRRTDHFHGIASKSRDRFDRAVHVLEATAAAGGIKPTAPPR